MKKIIIICTLFLLLLSGCRNDGGPIHQTLEDVQKIEILYTSNGEGTVLYTLSEDELADFWARLSALKFKRYFNDPETQLGHYAVRILYDDGYVDALSVSACFYSNPYGKDLRGSGWYYIADSEAFDNILSQYLPK